MNNQQSFASVSGVRRSKVTDACFEVRGKLFLRLTVMSGSATQENMNCSGIHFVYSLLFHEIVYLFSGI